MKIVDADGHVAEGSTLAVEAMRRWPQHIQARTDGRPGLTIEGRNHPEDRGPGAGCPPDRPDLGAAAPAAGVRGGVGSRDRAGPAARPVRPGGAAGLHPSRVGR